jgi:putative addiction module CopG family antidote
MAIQLSPETERLIEAEIARGRFGSIDEIVREGIRARSDEVEAERWQKHREAIARTREFVTSAPIQLHGVTLRELIEEGRRM